MVDRPLILWDFDGTLATRDGMWSGALLEALDEQLPGHGIELAQIRLHMRDGWPWSRAHLPHPELADPSAWWLEVEQVFSRALQSLEVETRQIAELTSRARARFIDPSTGWRLYPETVDTLTRARQLGFNGEILSNHVPELPVIARHLGLDPTGADPLVGAIHNSAVSGYEKPHPRAFELVLEASARTPAQVWMVGDNPVADIAGAEAVGIRAVLVERPATTLIDALDEIVSGAGR